MALAPRFYPACLSLECLAVLTVLTFHVAPLNVMQCSGKVS
jgi:hypothetical protein